MDEKSGPDTYDGRHPRSDEERVLLFEWHARQFAGMETVLPPIPLKRQLDRDLPAEVWNSLLLRYSMVRKFLIGSDDVRLDRVWQSMISLARTADRPDENLIESLNRLILDLWPERLDSSHGIVVGNVRIPDGDTWLADLLYGAAMHSDVGKAKTLLSYGPGLTTSAWAHWVAPRSGFSIRQLILNTLLTVEKRREDGALPIGPRWRLVLPADEAQPTPQRTALASWNATIETGLPYTDDIADGIIDRLVGFHPACIAGDAETIDVVITFEAESLAGACARALALMPEATAVSVLTTAEFDARTEAIHV